MPHPKRNKRGADLFRTSLLIIICIDGFFVIKTKSKRCYDFFRRIKRIGNLVDILTAAHCAVGSSAALTAADCGNFLENISGVCAFLNGLCSRGCREVELTVLNCRKYRHGIGEFGLNRIAKGSCLVGSAVARKNWACELLVKAS